MSIFDSVVGQASGPAPDVANLATKVGLPTEMVEKAIAALGAAHPKPGDTVQEASAQTGIDHGIMSQIVQQIGGEGSLGAFASMISNNPAAQGMLEKFGLGGMAKGLFGGS